jgi:hypothetical protein
VYLALLVDNILIEDELGEKSVEAFEQYIKDEFDIEMPEGDISGAWFAENGLPMIVACSCCEMTMASPNALVDDEGHCFCAGCAE